MPLKKLRQLLLLPHLLPHVHLHSKILKAIQAATDLMADVVSLDYWKMVHQPNAIPTLNTGAVLSMVSVGALKSIAFVTIASTSGPFH